MVLATLFALVFVVGIFSTSTFEASAASITFHVLPLKGNVNRSVNINGAGWVPLATITVKFGTKVVAVLTADGTGAWSGSFKVPQATAGAHTIVATDGTNTLSHSFTVVPHLTVKPRKGAVGVIINLLGTGFAASSTVKVTFNGVVVKSLTTNSTGGFPANTTFKVPNDALATYPVIAKDAKGNMANSNFTIT
jgi:hypothetical protein